MKLPAKPDVQGLDIEPAFVNVFNVVMIRPRRASLSANS